MQSHHLIGWLVIGLIAGALAGRLVEGRGLGCLANIVVGIAGAVIGGAIIDQLDPNARYGLPGSIVVAFIGACLLLAVLRLLSGGRPLGGGRSGPSIR
ncbi:MAG TPA: GlsB/YeaQ/YmgE family stress response membrane protein [Candidatus Dormibacteraeota bacterium]|nr:GlsB/YeaQ/YmgE family stress response membrane protein [Candidatus Dormibacteraeota bacterium]